MIFQARTKDAIFSDLLLEKQNLPNLSGLIAGDVTDVPTLITSLENGTAAEWVLWLYNMAVAIASTEEAMVDGITDIQDLLASNRVPNERWYIEKALDFQYGDTLIIDPVTYQVTYATVNEVNKIIASCTTKLIENSLYLKVRRLNDAILANDELIAFQYYLSKVKAAGTRVIVENFAADKITLNMEIYYAGNNNVGSIQSQVEAAINTYLDNIEFDSKINVNKLIDSIQSIVGVNDPRVISAYGIDDLGINRPFLHEYTTTAGYAVINPDTPLSSTTYIKYIPQ